MNLAIPPVLFKALHCLLLVLLHTDNHCCVLPVHLMSSSLTKIKLLSPLSLSIQLIRAQTTPTSTRAYGTVQGTNRMS